MKKTNFQKFYTPKSNAQKKEEFKQAKRKARVEKNAYFEEKKRLEIKKRGGTVKTAKTAAAIPAEKMTAKTLFPMPLNKYIAHGGICSRREAVTLIKEGKINVNNEVITEPGFKVQESDIVKCGNKKVIPQKELVYILLNKPKDYITTSDDPQGRKTVLDLLKGATTQRIYPVGRLD
ncbi:MAG: rRNA pseudouridine synthase, partial [Bacteroidetes bacterium]|nr:rRNA pseudouridine synthase [Bacteroidota bacterium]